MDGVGQDEGAGPGSHFRLDHRLAEAYLTQHSRHIDPTGHKEVKHSQRHDRDADMKGDAHCSILFEDFL